MKKFLVSVKNSEGFTLVELMVVVAIIGLLASVALPNFRRYQAKSRTSEAKLQLAAAYAAQEAFNQEFGSYHTCLDFMGYNPEDEAGNRYYTVGFDAGITLDLSGIGAGGCNRTAAIDANVEAFNGTKAMGGVAQVAASAAALALAEVPVSGTGYQEYVITAEGCIFQDNVQDDGACTDNTEESQITIDENKLINIVSTGY